MKQPCFRVPDNSRQKKEAEIMKIKVTQVFPCPGGNVVKPYS